ncbi:phosphoribosyl transferase domain-containing protein [Corallococcus coralloides DSM 2259]|uniref:Phosphoribosyl transferase domain-containing protein n=1 Tax=Corallococcus coralloides (strain ATCC 25202 / DSM 2259 / NBRC 100086 / M2) TaxID=1144275 RepID=H8MMT2_CORCM|nr:phosphoribosyltransferase [Corallococcus coralloides]AFE03833.1 phosphoribosyl transferase domain-containing protein [Corallococcus coralloides DSM 2259]
MAIKRAAPPKSQDQRNPSPKSSVPSAAQKEGAEKLVSIPNDMVLAPQVEAPRQPTGRDQSRHKSTGVVELSWAEFDRKVQQLARTIRQAWEPQAVVGVAHGGVFVGGALAGALGCEFFPVRISRRSRDKAERPQERGQPQVSGEMPAELKGRRVLIVDDIASSGDTLELATALAKKVGAKEIRTACLIARPEGFTPDHVGLSTDSLFVFPWDYQPVMGDAHLDDDPDKAGA